MQSGNLEGSALSPPKQKSAAQEKDNVGKPRT